MKTPRIIVFFALLVAAVALTACFGRQVPADAPNIKIKDAWVRTKTGLPGDLARTQPPAPADAWKTPVGPFGLGPNGAAFLTIQNSGGGADRLISASSESAARVSVQVMSVVGESGISTPVQAVDVPAKTDLQLKPDGYYIRLEGLVKEFKSGEKIEVTLFFEKSGAFEIEAPIVNP